MPREKKVNNNSTGQERAAPDPPDAPLWGGNSDAVHPRAHETMASVMLTEPATVAPEFAEPGRNVGRVPREIPQRKLYQDEIYGSKELRGLAVALMDTPEFQRLGHIYQLGMTYTVFRGANHRRFEHCVGVYFMSRTLMRRIEQNHARFYPTSQREFPHPGTWLSPRLYTATIGTPEVEERSYSPMGRWRGLTELVSAAALLHDLGHVAVGHTLEDEFDVFQKHDGLGGSRLFELLYGPRNVLGDGNPAAAQMVSEFFGPINDEQLPKPDVHDMRIPLPYVFEAGTYENFFPKGKDTQVPGLDNYEIRDLIYLILSFKETVTPEKYTTFAEELDAAETKATDDPAKLARLRFLAKVYARYSNPTALPEEYEQHPLFQPFMSDIVGNTICADLLDYLVRDGQRLKLDIRNNPRLQRYLVVRPQSSRVLQDQATLAVASHSNLRLTINGVYRNGLPRRDTISDLLDLMRERYRFAEVVYYHPKKCAFSTMLASALELSPSGPRDSGSIYPAPWSDLPAGGEHQVPHIAHLGDESLVSFLASLDTTDSAATATARLARRIAYRDEYRLLFTLDYDAAKDAGGPSKIVDDLRTFHGSTRRKRWEAMFAEFVRRSTLRDIVGDEPAVLIYCPNVRMQAKEVAAHAELVPGHVIPLNRQRSDSMLRNEIDILNQKYQRLWRLYIFVHPRLAMAATDPDFLDEAGTVFGSIVDTFCSHYGLSQVSRERGARLAYRSLRDRVATHWRRWLANWPLSSLTNEVEQQIYEVLFDNTFWQDLLQASDHIPVPISESDFDKGFIRAVAIAAADGAAERLRDAWPERARSIRGTDWYSRGKTPRGERDRMQVVSALTDAAESYLNVEVSKRRRGGGGTWDALVSGVGGALQRIE